MIEIIFIMLGCIALSMFIIFCVETYSMAQDFTKLDKNSKINHVKKAIPVLIIVAILIWFFTERMLKIMTEQAPLMP